MYIWLQVVLYCVGFVDGRNWEDSWSVFKKFFISFYKKKFHISDAHLWNFCLLCWRERGLKQSCNCIYVKASPRVPEQVHILSNFPCPSHRVVEGPLIMTGEPEITKDLFIVRYGWIFLLIHILLQMCQNVNCSTYNYTTAKTDNNNVLWKITFQG